MAILRKFVSASSLILVAVGVSAVAVSVLSAFPANPLVWQAASWTLVAALVGLLVLVPVSGYALAASRSARTWRRAAPFLLGFACLAAVAIGSV
ncbi:MAG TPA: hypothetical protein VFF96_08325 [Pseudoxanthomonas sp.]|nr:hypothetical protein [Pseudoxanthomonas sp.]